MNRHLLTLIILAVPLLTAGCTNRQIYEALQNSLKNECLNVPPDQYEECVEKASIAYETYLENLRDLQDEQAKNKEKRLNRN